MLRALLIALLVANAAVWAWRQPAVARALSLPGPDTQREPARLERQVNPQAVQVLPPQAVRSAPAVARERCLQTGPLRETAFGEATRELEALGLSSDRWLDIRRELPGRWIVYMGPYKAAGQLARKRDELKELKLSGDELVNHPTLSPGLSLGQFGSRAEAERALTRIQGQGARSAKVVVLAPPEVEHQLRLEHLPAPLAEQLSAAEGGSARWQDCDAAP